MLVVCRLTFLCFVWSNMSVTCWPRRCPMHWLMHCWEPIPYHTHTIILIIWPWKFLLLKDAFLRYYDVWRFNVNIHICDLKAQQSQLPNVHLSKEHELSKHCMHTFGALCTWPARVAFTLWCSIAYDRLALDTDFKSSNREYAAAESLCCQWKFNDWQEYQCQKWNSWRSETLK